jgi:hypothetical protein
VSGLGFIAQDDFGAGMLRGLAPDVQPGVGVYNAVNGLLNDDGDVYRRGGTRFYGAGLPGPVTFGWSGYLGNVPCQLYATATDLYTLDGAGNPVHLSPGGLDGPVQAAVVADRVWLPNGKVYDGNAVTDWARPPDVPASGPLRLAATANRLIVACGNRVAFSVPDDPANFVVDDFHALPSGVQVVGLASIRDTLLVFSNYGLWSITNLALDLTDPAGNVQQALSLVTPEVSLIHESGLCAWAGRIVAPCIDRCYLVDALSPPTPISDSIVPVYMAAVRAGQRPGGAKVFRNHLLLPLLANGTPQAVLICRLNRPVRGRLVYYPWSALTGHAGGLLGADVNLLGPAPRFVAGHTSGRLVDLTDLFNPDASNASDADGSVFEFDVETRDFPTGNGNLNHVRALALRYTMTGAASVQAGYSYGSAAQRYGDIRGSYADVKAGYASYAALTAGQPWPSGFPPTPGDPTRYWTRLAAVAGESPGIDPIRWALPQAARVRYIRWRFRCTDAPASLVLHHLDFSVRQATNQR